MTYGIGGRQEQSWAIERRAVRTSDVRQIFRIAFRMRTRSVFFDTRTTISVSSRRFQYSESTESNNRPGSPVRQ